MNLQQLLSQITALSKKYDLLNERTGGFFNVFEIANVAHYEVTVCRMIYELLSPSGSHCQGTLYLKLFLERVLQIQVGDTELETVSVYREYVIDEKRRIDLVIETANHFVPIEVKIYSGEQQAQCWDYYNFAKETFGSKGPVLYYLTRFGESPSEFSTKTLAKTDDGYQVIINISFADDILDWLELCLKQTMTLKIAPIREVLLQFMAVIRKFTGKMEDDEEMEIKELLLSSADNMKSAVAIRNALDEVKQEMILRVFQAIDKKVGKERLHNEYDYADLNFTKIKKFYSHNYSTYPGISYPYKDNVKPNIDIWVRIEIDEKIFVGYCCPVNKKAGKQPLNQEEAERILNIKLRSNDWWASYEYCTIDNECPDFKSMNDAYYKLFDKAYFNKYVDYCTDQILSLL